MVITLDNGQTVTIYEDSNLLREIKPYIDEEIFTLLEDKYCNADELVFENEALDEKLVNAEGYIDELLEKIDKLESKISDLEEELND